MKAAILGCNGYIGKHLALFLKKEGWNVYGYGKQQQTDADVDTYHVVDVQKKRRFRKNWISPLISFFYFSGITGIASGYNDYEKFIEVNEIGIVHLLDKMKSANSKARIVFPSTRLVYKGVTNLALNEDAEKECKTIYALNKWFGEQIINQYSQYFGIPFTIFRICVPYGNLLDDKYSYGTIGFFLSKARNKTPITLFGHGEPQRTFTHVEDICLQIAEVLKYPESLNNTYNTMGQQFSLKEVAEQIGTRFGVNLEYLEWPRMDARMESGDTIFDSTKLFSLTRKPLKHNFTTWLEAIK